MRKTGIFTIFCFLILIAFGCGSRATSTSADEAVSPPTSRAEKLGPSTLQAPAEDRVAANTAAGSSPVSQTSRQQITSKISLDQTQTALIDTAPSDRKIIRNAELNLETEAPEEAQRQITAIAENTGGFVVESQQTSSDTTAKKHDTISMSVRVPSAKFSDAMAAIRDTSQRVIFETVKGDDVTEEFIDVEARLKAKKALEQQFVEIMKRAATVDDALSVQSQLADVRGDIEKIEGRRRFLENQSSLSTIKIRLQTPTAFSASSSGFGYRLGESFATGLDFALNFVLGLVTFVVAIVPFALIIGLPTFLFLRFVWRRQNQPRSVTEIAKEELGAS